MEVYFSSQTGLQLTEQEGKITELRERLDLLQRELAKVEPRALLASEQVRMLTRESESQRAMLLTSASDLTTGIEKVQEQADSVQKFVVSLEEAVSRQIEVRSLYTLWNARWTEGSYPPNQLSLILAVN